MKECSVSVGKNYSLIELLEAVDGVGEERKDEGEEEKKCEICGEEEQKMVCCDCGEGCRRQCESCCVHLHQLDQLSIHRRTQIKRKEKKGEEKEEEKEEEEQIKEEDKKEGDEDEAEKKGKSKQKPKRRKKKSKGVSKKGSTQVSPIATKVMSLLNQKKHISAFFTAFHHAWSDGDCAAILAMCYFDGVGTKISEIAAPKWAQFADESGSWFGKGIWFYLKGSDFYDQVNPILLPFADEGNSLAQRCVGRCFEHFGEKETSFIYYCKGAEQGIACATNNMAGNLEDGVGVEKDEPKAFKIMTELADEHCWPQSQKNIGYDYQSGSCGVEVDEKKAAHYFKLAADQGHLIAMNMLAACYHEGKGVPQSNLLTYHTYKMAHEGGLLAGTSNLGFCFSNGVGVEKDDGMAVYYYTIAADKGSVYSQKILANRFENGRGVEQNHERALHYFRLAAKEGDKEAIEAVNRLDPKEPN